MTPEEREKRIKAGMLAIPARAICWSTTHDELARLVIDAARLVLEAADKAVPVVTEAYHIAVRESLYGKHLRAVVEDVLAERLWMSLRGYKGALVLTYRELEIISYALLGDPKDATQDEVTEVRSRVDQALGDLKEKERFERRRAEYVAKVRAGEIEP